MNSLLVAWWPDLVTGRGRTALFQLCGGRDNRLMARGFPAGRLGSHPAAVWTVKHVVSRVDRWVVRLSRGRTPPLSSLLVPTMLLTTPGRKTGQPRTTPLVYMRRGDDYLVANARPRGERRNPWVLNLEASGTARIRVDGRSRQVAARRLSDREAEQAWPAFVRVWPAFDEHFAATGERTVFVLEDTNSSHEESGNSTAGTRMTGGMEPACHPRAAHRRRPLFPRKEPEATAISLTIGCTCRRVGIEHGLAGPRRWFPAGYWMVCAASERHRVSPRSRPGWSRSKAVMIVADAVFCRRMRERSLMGPASERSGNDRQPAGARKLMRCWSTKWGIWRFWR